MQTMGIIHKGTQDFKSKYKYEATKGFRINTDKRLQVNYKLGNSCTAMRCERKLY